MFLETSKKNIYYLLFLTRLLTPSNENGIKKCVISQKKIITS